MLGNMENKLMIFSSTGQEADLAVTGTAFYRDVLSRRAVSAYTLKAVSKCQSLLNIARPCQQFHLLSVIQIACRI